MFRIGDFSRLCRLPVSALRYYADLGLLQPAHVDPLTNYRYYSFEQLPRLNRILALRDLGLSLEQIKRVLDEDLPPGELRGMLRLRQAEIAQHLAEEQARLARVEARLLQIEQEGNMPEYEVVLKSIEALRVLSIREVIPKPENVGTLLMESAQAVIGQGIQPTGTPFVIFHDAEFKPQDMDIEVVFPVAPTAASDVPLDGGRRVGARDLPGIAQAACIIHKGSYETLEHTYAAIGQWIERSGYEIVGPSREVYLNPPTEGEAITEIQYPVRKV